MSVTEFFDGSKFLITAAIAGLWGIMAFLVALWISMWTGNAYLAWIGFWTVIFGPLAKPIQTRSKNEQRATEAIVKGFSVDPDRQKKVMTEFVDDMQKHKRTS